MISSPGRALEDRTGHRVLWWGGVYHEVDFIPTGEAHNYGLWYTDVPKGQLAIFHGKRLLFLRGMRESVTEQYPGSSIRHEHVIHLDGHPGIAFMVRVEDRGGVVQCRMFLVGRRFFYVVVSSSQILYERNPVAPRRFLRSFRLLPSEGYV